MPTGISSSKKHEENALQEKTDAIFNDPEAKKNLVGFYNLALQIDRRNNPHLYEEAEKPE